MCHSDTSFLHASIKKLEGTLRVATANPIGRDGV